MTFAEPQLTLASAPFLHSGMSTNRVMYEVLFGAAVVVAFASWLFGASVLLLVGACVLAALATEIALGGRGPGRFARVGDGSAILTGVLLALTLPPAMPLWMAALGGAVSIALGKVIWGGLGFNRFNPALVGRAFLQAAFPTVITTWSDPPASFWDTHSSNFAAPLMRGSVDAMSAATPLGLQKFEKVGTDTWLLFSGECTGSLGETSGVLLIALGLWFAIRRVFDWRLPVATLAATVGLSACFHFVAPASFPSPLFMLGSGGLLFAAVFMVTDPVTTPLTAKGAWWFGGGGRVDRRADPSVRRTPRGSDVCDLVDERRDPADRSPHATDALWRCAPMTVDRASSLRLVVSASLAGLISGLLLSGVYLWTLPAIQRNQAEALERAIFAVVPGAIRFRAEVERDGTLRAMASSDTPPEPDQVIYRVEGSDGSLVGYAVPAKGPGFMDDITLLYGFDSAKRAVVGMQVLESRETPGLGDKITRDERFLANFSELAVDPAIEAVKAGKKTAAHQVDCITGATISSKAVVSIIHRSLTRWRELMATRKPSQGAP